MWEREVTTVGRSDWVVWGGWLTATLPRLLRTVWRASTSSAVNVHSWCFCVPWSLRVGIADSRREQRNDLSNPDPSFAAGDWSRSSRAFNGVEVYRAALEIADAARINLRRTVITGRERNDIGLVPHQHIGDPIARCAPMPAPPAMPVAPSTSSAEPSNAVINFLIASHPVPGRHVPWRTISATRLRQS